jgi:hypothetical protein
LRDVGRQARAWNRLHGGERAFDYVRQTIRLGAFDAGGLGENAGHDRAW